MTFPVKFRMKIYNAESGLYKCDFGKLKCTHCLLKDFVLKVETMFTKVWKTQRKISIKN